MVTYGLIGYPLSHSFSKQYFDAKFADLGIKNAQFLNFELDEIDKIKTEVLPIENLKGFCITIPYKKAIINYLHNVSTEVEAIGACNCVTLRNGLLTGYNTDAIGFQKALVPKLRAHHTEALILGTGGAAAAIKYTLNKLGIIAQSVGRSAPIANTISYNSLTHEIIKKHSLIINTTPLGTYPNIQSKPDIPYNALTSNHLLYDVVYNPASTAFLKEGELMGCTVENGYQMLINQAEENWALWNQ